MIKNILKGRSKVFGGCLLGDMPQRTFSEKPKWHNTTILAVKKNKELVLIGDGQVTYGSTRVKTNGVKIRKLHGSAVCGFAGSVADAFTLLEGLEAVMAQNPDQTLKSCIKYAKQWRTGKYLRHLEATLVVCDKDLIVELDGTGNVIEIDSGVLGVGSGGLFAECNNNTLPLCVMLTVNNSLIGAARALLDVEGYTAQQIAEKAMKIAADKCIYTSHTFVQEKLTWD